MAYTFQAELVREIADLMREYRDDPKRFARFGFKCGLALPKLPIAGGVMHTPKTTDERFAFGDKAFRANYETDREAFFAAVDAFAANAQFLAWNGEDGGDSQFDLVKDMSRTYTLPTMQIQIIYRRKGGEEQQKLQMFFVGFDSDQAAIDYAEAETRIA